MKRYCVSIIRVPEGTDARKGPEAILEKTLSENFSKWRKNVKPQIQKMSKNSSMVNTKNHT